MITIIDYGMGNLRSVSKALDHLGLANAVSDDHARIATADRLILPGVGAFGDAMDELRKRELIEPMAEFLAGGRPMLGICLGMQLVLDASEESPGVAGLGYIPGEVRRFRIAEKVPHMGWNTVRPVADCPLFKGIEPESHFYFVHSYCAEPSAHGAAENTGGGATAGGGMAQSGGIAVAPAVAGVTDYGGEFASVLWRDNLVATQFHPEKSQANGLAMLANFGRM